MWISTVTKPKTTIIEQDPLDSQLRILDWIFYQVCSNEIKQFEGL